MKLRSKLFYSYISFLIIYSLFTLIPAPSRAVLSQYHVSAAALRIIDVTIIVLLAVIWYIGFYGYAKLRSYTQIIQTDKDGKQVTKLTTGIFILVMWLPISMVVAAVLNYFSLRHTGLLAAATIIDNYLSLLLPLAAFIFIGLGAHGLRIMVRQYISFYIINALALLVFYIGAVYQHLVIVTANRNAVYHLPFWLIMLTIIVPYIFMWFIGLAAAYSIYCYSKKVKGIVYKKSWNFVGIGIGWLILTSMGLQYLTSLVAHLAHLSIYWTLAIVYSILIIVSLGFVLIAIGANGLRAIEETEVV